MSPSTCHGPDGLDLSREEAWVLHVAILARVERRVEADRSPDSGMALLDRVEACEPLDSSDRSLVRDVLRAYLTDAPERDRGPARSILSTLDAQPSSSQ